MRRKIGMGMGVEGRSMGFQGRSGWVGVARQVRS
jgi:hypothetical protein